jgi:tetratricopeptide (TPR) repeat protein
MNPTVRRIATTTLTAWLTLVGAPSAIAQSQAIVIRATGMHAAAAGEPPELSRQLARADAQRMLEQEAVTRLQNVDAIKALNLTPTRMAAYVAALLEAGDAAVATARSTFSVELRVRLDADDMRRRLSGLRKDHEATYVIDDAWSRIQQLYPRIVELSQPDRSTSRDKTDRVAGLDRALKSLATTRLAAQVSAGLARTEENPGGGRMPSEDGRARAKRLAEAASALAPDSADAHEAMGDVLIDASEPEAAEAEYKKALLADPDSSRLHVKRAEAIRQQGKLPEAAAELRTALQRDANSARAHSDLGMVLRSQRSLAEAVAEQKEALRIDPDYVDAHNELAITLARQGRFPEAAAEFREMIRIDPDSAAGYFNLATVLADMDQDAESAAALREVVRINPNHYNAHYNLGEMFRLEGKFDESVKQFREYLRLAPDTPQNRRNIQRAKGLIEKFDNP